MVVVILRKTRKKPKERMLTLALPRRASNRDDWKFLSNMDSRALVKSCQDNIDRMLRSKESGDVLYEVIIGGLDDVVYESCGEGKMNAFYERITEVVTESVKSFCKSRRGG